MIEERKTKDGSVTYYNPDVDETYHSVSGAEEEAMVKYVEPLELSNLGGGVLRVLDFCFGLGYNSAALIDKVIELNEKGNNIDQIEIIAIEKDLEILGKVSDVNSNFKSYNLIKEIAEQVNSDNATYNIFKEFEGVKILLKLIISDALLVIEDFEDDYFDSVLFDPFSPKKQPELWEKEVFEVLHAKMKKNGRLTTYSCATHFRVKLRETGFKVLDGPILGRKSPSTIGVKDQFI